MLWYHSVFLCSNDVSNFNYYASNTAQFTLISLLLDPTTQIKMSLSDRLNCPRDKSGCLKSDGKSFQSRDTAAADVLSLKELVRLRNKSRNTKENTLGEPYG